MQPQSPPRNPPPLSQLFANVLLPNPSLATVRDAAAVCYRIAYAYLLIRTRDMPVLTLGATLDDLAFDAVCFAFARNGNLPHFFRLRAFLPEDEVRLMSDAQVLSRLRQSMEGYMEAEIVNRIMDSYPPLEHILRNLKNAISGSKALRNIRVSDEHWVALNEAGSRDQTLPEFPPALLERILILKAGKRTTSPALVPVLVRALRDQTTYRRAFRLNGLAVIVLGMYFRTGRHIRGAFAATQGENPSTVSRTIFRSVAGVETRLRHTMVEKEGLAASTYVEYIHAAAAFLLSTIHPSRENGLSLYEILAEHLTSVTRSAYYAEHRQRLEVILKSACQQYYQRQKHV